MENPTELISIREKIKTLNNQTSNDYGTVALNVYQIYPKTISYSMRCIGRSTTTNQFLIPIDATSKFSWNKVPDLSVNEGPFDIGNNFSRFFRIYTTINVGLKWVDIDYVNIAGNRVIAYKVPVTNIPIEVLTGVININRISWSNDPANVNLDNIVRAMDTEMQVLRNIIGSSSVITVPNSYVGVVRDVYIGSEGTETIRMIVKSADNNVKYVRRMVNVPSIAGRVVSLGAVNFPLDSGDSVFFSSEALSTQYKYVYANVVITAV